jgi:single-strand DNA-binding protein
MKDETCFVDVDTFGRTAETINQYMNKGRAILIEGRLRFRQWTTEDGQKRSKLSVVAENFQFVGSRGEGGGSQNRATAAPPADGAPGSNAPGPDDDIPF